MTKKTWMLVAATFALMATPAIADTLGGQVQFTFTGIPSVLSYLKSGRLRAIGLPGIRGRLRVVGGLLGHAGGRCHPIVRRGQVLGDIASGRPGRHNVTGHMRSSRPP